MKVNKTQAVLFMFKKLMERGEISKADIQNELDINDVTFRRYIQELRAFLSNFDKENEIKYSKTRIAYLLIK